jgi:GLPGLI family protein
MKKIVLYLIGILFVQCLSAQGLKVVYEESVNTTISREQLESVGSPEAKERIEQKLKSMAKQKKTAELVIGKNVSLYTIFEAEMPEEPSERDETTKVRIIKKGAFVKYRSYYKDLEENQILAQAEVEGKIYLVEQPPLFEDKKWSITKEEKIIAGYKCIKATLSNIDAWYCPEISINDGPQYFYGLPGLILEIELRSASANVKYSCTSVTTLTDTPEIQIGQGEKMTKPEFEKFVEEYKKSLGMSSSVTKL